MPLTDQTPTQTLQGQIAEYRKANASRRARAFIDAPERVLGFAVNPVTVESWTMLNAIESRFAVGGGVPLEGDIRNFLWIHSPFYMPFRWYNVATFARWFSLLPFAAMLHKQKDEDWYCAALAMAVADIQAIIGDTFADAPRGGSKDATQPTGCIEAQMIHIFSKEYGWSVKQVRKLPLARAIQLARQFGTSDEDQGEQEIKFAHLRRRNAELAEERARIESEKASAQPAAD